MAEVWKFIHCADLHLDSPLVGLAGRADAPIDEIRAATRRALENLVTLALTEAVKFVVIAGDVYDGDWPDYTTGLFFNAQMSRLNAAGIPVYLISGNHDAASNITRSLVLPPNVTQFSVDHPETVVLDELCVALHGQGFKEREVRENLVPSYPDALPGYFNIGILHTSAEGQAGHETYAPCRLDELIQKGYDYWALGHIHKRQVLHRAPWVVFPGNLQGRHIRETGEKGCMLVTVADGNVTLAFRPLDVVRWCLCPVDLDGVQTDDAFSARVAAAVAQAVDQHPGLPIAMRVVLQGQTAFHGTLLADAERYRHEVENAVNQAAPGRVWIERVKIATEPMQAAPAVALDGDAVAALVHHIDETVADAAFLEAVASDMREVQSRMRAYTRREGATVIESAEDVKPLLADARSLLLAILGQGRTTG
ncbi:DNA repair exonuclease [Alicyclobacillus cycloheptanicus]|uniref:DNA repair exonuclease SbcCD nuclease subunit n=1 Tax=Alicyclobacillus cycloheptanicus TaxID=1457 RepID=A0ABT9XFF0_9BACL|nr:DNA repair exonuclease [Alicyclobacillus cycloheptanicus]MDQ0189021.1 DNA repair exonuclease SbcCD nuclease subunit [Alicyclobacillus cycloheptanicus]WDM01641.1 DNA repair exonuclease [Alicyclobacillus cycloheptanicus]